MPSDVVTAAVTYRGYGMWLTEWGSVVSTRLSYEVDGLYVTAILPPMPLAMLVSKSGNGPLFNCTRKQLVVGPYG